MATLVTRSSYYVHAASGERTFQRPAVSPNGQPLSRRGRSSPASASGVDTHRDSIS
eukprot:COSAG01_NODE_50860_length_359_cov_2.788462_1_plen_55_part_01